MIMSKVLKIVSCVKLNLLVVLEWLWQLIQLQLGILSQSHKSYWNWRPGIRNNLFGSMHVNLPRKKFNLQGKEKTTENISFEKTGSR